MGDATSQLGLTRRGLLKGTALLSAGLIGGVWTAAKITDGSPEARLPDSVLGAAEQQMLYIQANAILDDVLPAQAQERAQWLDAVVRNCALGVLVLTPRLQRETLELLSALTHAPLRFVVIGQWAGWQDQSVEQTQSRLQRLAHSDNATHRIVYRALRDLVIGAYYSDRRSWQGIGYDGPVVDLNNG